MSPKVFCAECGNTETPLIANLCPDCYLKNNPPLKIKTPITNKICPECNATQRSHRWIIQRKQKTSLEELLWRSAYIAVDEAIQFKHPWNVPPLSPQVSYELSPQITDEASVERKNKFAVPVEITVLWKHDETLEPLKEVIIVVVEITSTFCDTCGQVQRGYAEATIQIRFPKTLRKQQRIDRQNQIVDQIQRLIERSPPATITDQKSQKNGVDLSLNQKSIAYTIANQLKKQHRAVIKKSFKQMYFKHGEHLKKLVISAILPE